MARKPKPKDLSAARRVWRLAKSDAEFLRWVKKPTPKRGRHAISIDKYLLPGLDLMTKAAEQQLGMTQTAFLKWYAKAYKPAELATLDSIWQRLHRKLKKRRFKKIVWPPGIDPSKFRFSTDD